MELNNIELCGYTYVTINPVENGLMVLTHKDTTVEMNGSTLMIKDPVNNNNAGFFNGMIKNFTNYGGSIFISGNHNMVNCNNYNSNINSFNGNMNNVSVSKAECQTEHLIECVPNVSYITLSGAMHLEAEVTLNKDCKISVDGSGGIKYRSYGQHYNNLSLVLKGSGDIKMIHGYECTINNLSVSLSGSGDVKLNGNINSKIVNANLILTGSGDMRIDGTMNQATIVLTGSGDIDGFSVEKWVNVTLTGSGSVMGNAVGYVEDGNYKHTLVNKNKTGSGSIKIR